MADLINVHFETADGIRHHLKVSMPLGMGGRTYYVTVDNYHCGMVIGAKKSWTPYIKSNLLTSDDIGAILDAIHEKECPKDEVLGLFTSEQMKYSPKR